jgi:hypothetical protein
MAFTIIIIIYLFILFLLLLLAMTKTCLCTQLVLNDYYVILISPHASLASGRLAAN